MSDIPSPHTAEEAASWFQSATRHDGTTYITLPDDAPEWIGDAVYAAHDGMLPDDRIYQLCRDAFVALGEGCDDAHEFADESVHVYTGERIAWLGSHASRPALCDEAASEYGSPADGIVAMIGQGQYLEASRVFAACEAACADR